MNFCNKIVKICFISALWILVLISFILINYLFTETYIKLSNNCLEKFDTEIQCCIVVAVIVVVQLFFISFCVLFLISGPYFIHTIYMNNLDYQHMEITDI